jgi:outer membrane murein-binding lipoprotein Lpp
MRQIAGAAALVAVIAAVSVQAANVTPPGPPTKVPGPVTLDQLNGAVNDLQARVANDERQIAQLDTRVTQLEAAVGGRKFTDLETDVQQLHARLQKLRADFDKHTHTYRAPKFTAIANVGSLVNNTGGFFNYVVPLFTPEQMKQTQGNVEVTYTTGAAKY